MRQIDIGEAAAHLSQLVDEAASGDEIVITRAGKPVARLVALEPTRLHLCPGLLKDKMWIADDFDVPLPEDVLATFEGQSNRTKPPPTLPPPPTPPPARSAGRSGFPASRVAQSDGVGGPS